jgi:hypothetical protein
MRGIPQAASARLPTAARARRWSLQREQWLERRRQTRMERLESIERLRAEERRARRSGAYRPELRPWL